MKIEKGDVVKTRHYPSLSTQGRRFLETNGFITGTVILKRTKHYSGEERTPPSYLLDLHPYCSGHSGYLYGGEDKSVLDPNKHSYWWVSEDLLTVVKRAKRKMILFNK